MGSKNQVHLLLPAEELESYFAVVLCLVKRREIEIIEYDPSTTRSVLSKYSFNINLPTMINAFSVVSGGFHHIFRHLDNRHSVPSLLPGDFDEQDQTYSCAGAFQVPMQNTKYYFARNEMDSANKELFVLFKGIADAIDLKIIGNKQSITLVDVLMIGFFAWAKDANLDFTFFQKGGASLWRAMKYHANICNADIFKATLSLIHRARESGPQSSSEAEVANAIDRWNMDVKESVA